MKKKLIGSLVAVLLLACGLFAVSNLPVGAVYAQQPTVNQSMSEEEMRRQIEELRTLIDTLLLAMNTNNVPSPPQGQAGIPSISSQRAREIAVELVGHGTAREVMLFMDSNVLTFEVDVRNENARYMVYINALSGSVIRMSRFEDSVQDVVVPPAETTTQPQAPQQEQTPQPTQTPQPQTPQQTQTPAPSTASPSPNSTSSPSPQATQTPSSNTSSSDRNNRPSNPAISLDRAIEIAYADIAARGINATFRRDSGMSWERGQWVWELEFRTQGERMPIIEFYINVDNGNIVKFEWDD